MEFQEGICKLCLEKHERCKAIDENTTNCLSILLPKTGFTVIQGPVICRNCAEILIRCYDFKVMCLHTYKSIVNKNSVKLDLKDIYLSKNATGVSEDQNICGFCMGLVKNVSAVAVVMLEKMLKQCLPELDLNIIKKLVICAPCHRSLENCFHFATSCLIAEEKIRKYCETLDIGCKGEIELSSVLQFLTRDVTSEVDGNSFDKIKVEQQFCEDRSGSDEREICHGSGIIKLEETLDDDCKYATEDVKIKNEIFMEMVDGKDDDEHQFIPKNILAFQEESCRLGFIKTEELFCEENLIERKKENVAEMEDQKFLLNENVEIKTEENNLIRFEGSIALPQHEVTSFNRKQTFLMPNLKEGLTKSCIKQTVTKKNLSAITMYKCDSCLYQTKYKTGLKTHSLTHKDPSEVTMYKCDICLYQAKRKGDLKIHMLKHKDPSEVTMYKCDSCLYQTRQKAHLKLHLLKHKDASEVTMYKCHVCLFQTKFRNVLKTHLLRHKDPSEVTMYNCDSCLYQTKFKSNFTIHLQKHKDPSEVTMYKCDSCSYQTKFKSVLNTHLLKHKDPSELTMYKCDSCLYQTKFKSSLTIHLQKHKDPSEVEVTTYKCSSCSYQTKFKGNLKIHLLSHKDLSEVIMYKCDSCLFQTKYKKGLKTHLLKHRDRSEVTTYKCDSCSYQTEFKGNLKIHLLSHKDPSEVTMYKCDFCLFQTKYKKGLKRHLLKHKDLSE